MSKRTLYNYLRTGELASVKFGSSRRFTKAEMARFVAEHRSTDMAS